VLAAPIISWLGLFLIGLETPRIIAWMLMKTERRVDLFGCYLSPGDLGYMLRVRGKLFYIRTNIDK
jgi:hypothetical protein